MKEKTKKFVVYRTQRLIQHNHISVDAKSRKEAIEKAKKEMWENAEYELVRESFKVEKEVA